MRFLEVVFAILCSLDLCSCHNVDDIVPPSISDCPDDISASVELGESEVPVYWTEPSAQDDNGRVTLISATHFQGEYFAIGSTPVIYIFADDSYNTNECSFNVNVSVGKESFLFLNTS